MRVGIVGGGLLGRLVALLAAEKGLSVTLYSDTDMDGTGSASYASAGMLAPMAELQSADRTIFEYGLKGIDFWKQNLRKFSQSVFHRFNGSIVSAHPGDRNELSRFRQLVEARFGYNKAVSLSCQNVHRWCPDLNLSDGFYFENDGHIDVRQLLLALSVELSKLNVICHQPVLVDDIGPNTIKLLGKTHPFDWVIDCRGYRATSSFKNLRGVRGDLIDVLAPDITFQLPIRLLTPRQQIYVVPRGNHRYLIGATEIESNSNAAISVRSILELLTAAYSIDCRFAEASIIETRLGFRPALPSNHPCIKVQPGLLCLNGLYRHGVLLSPVLAQSAISILYGNGAESPFVEEV